MVLKRYLTKQILNFWCFNTGSELKGSDPFAGDTSTVSPAPAALDDSDTVDDYTPGGGNTTATAEAQGTSGSPAIPEMAFSIDKTTVTAKSRALKAEYTTELAQDLKAIHGLSAETELANILSTEILAEMNREIVRLVNLNSVTSTRGAAAGTWNATNAPDNGGARWSVERYKALVQAIEHEANQIAVSTRRGKGNWVIVSNNVAAASKCCWRYGYWFRSTRSKHFRFRCNWFSNGWNFKRYV